MERGKEWSDTKHTLSMLLQQQIEELQPAVIDMQEDALIKHVAKRKVLFNLTRQGELQLVYALLALAENYLGKGLLNSSIRTLQEARAIKDVGDAGYLLGSALMKKQEKEEAIHWLEQCLDEDWIQPSLQHQAAAKLQAMTILQQLYFQTGQREKLLDLSYKKIQKAQENSTDSENHFHALTLLDLANIHEALGQIGLALQKIEGSISILESGVELPSKLVDAYIKRGQLMTRSGSPELVASNYIKAFQVIQTHPGCATTDKEASILEVYIESFILC